MIASPHGWTVVKDKTCVQLQLKPRPKRLYPDERDANIAPPNVEFHSASTLVRSIRIMNLRLRLLFVQVAPLATPTAVPMIVVILELTTMHVANSTLVIQVGGEERNMTSRIRNLFWYTSQLRRTAWLVVR
jgi:hypothetical protein